MRRFVHALFLGLVGAGVIHIVVLLLVPTYSQRDVWSVLSEQANFYRIVRLDPPQAQPLIGSLDPLFDAVACRFDLRDGVMRLHGEGSAPFWSISIHDRTGLNVFSLNDGSSPQGRDGSPAQGRLDFVVATPAQMIALRNDMPPELDGAAFIQAEIEEGIAVVRTFSPDSSFEPGIAAWLRDIDCAAH